MTTTSALETGLVGAVRAALAGAGDPVRAAGQQAYMKSAMPYRGITSPELRALLKPAVRRPAARRPTSRDALGGRRPRALGPRDVPGGALCGDRPHRPPVARALAGPRRPGPLPAPRRLGRLVGLRGCRRRRSGRPDPVAAQGRRDPRHARRMPWTGTSGFAAWRSSRSSSTASRPTSRCSPTSRRQPRGLPARAGVLHPQGRGLGVAPARAHRPRLGPGLRRHARTSPLRPLPPRGAQAPLTRPPPREVRSTSVESWPYTTLTRRDPPELTKCS